MKILITGTAGFIGYHLTKRLSEENHDIVCIDNISNYYDVKLKYGRLNSLGFNYNVFETEADKFIISSFFSNTCFIKIDLSDTKCVTKLFSEYDFDIILHLAAQAGVRYSILNPHAYISSNIYGFLNILEAAKSRPPKHFIYASSSSIYGLNSKIPFSENDPANRPASLYASTKLAGEQMAYSYSHLYKIPLTGLRFFTVYGPWGRPDMAPFIFTKSIIEGEPIIVFNNGDMKRDFTYIDDVIEGITRVINKIPCGNDEDKTPAAIYNIGNSKPVALMDFIHTIENTLNKKAIIQYAPMQAGDVNSTWADCSALARDTGFSPNTPLSTGIQEFVDWYKEYYK